MSVESLAAMQVALRVLTAISQRTDPDPADLDLLRSYSPLLSSAPPDELACEVIQQAARVFPQPKGRGREPAE